MHPSFLYKFTTSPAFLESSRLGSYRFTFPLEEVLDAYRLQFCSGDQPIMRVYETVLHKQEVQHVVLVHSPANHKLFSKFPLLTDDPNAICAYKDGRFIWRPYAISETHGCELICRPEEKLMDVQMLTRRQAVFYIWDNVAIALHVDKQVLKFDSDQLRRNLKFCDPGPAVFGTFDRFGDARIQVKGLWPDCDSLLEKEGSLEQCFTDLRLVLVGRPGSGKSSSGNILLGSDAFSAGSAAASSFSGSAQCCLQTKKVSERQVTIVDTPGFSDTPEVKMEIRRCMNLSAPGPHAFLLVIKVGTLIDEEQDVVGQMEEIFGKNVWQYTFVLLTYDNQPETDVEFQEAKLKTILPQIVGDRYYYLNINTKSSSVQQDFRLFKSVEKMVVENRGKFYSDRNAARKTKITDVDCATTD